MRGQKNAGAAQQRLERKNRSLLLVSCRIAQARKQPRLGKARQGKTTACPTH